MSSPVWRSPWSVLAIVSAVVLALDQITKYAAVNWFGPEGDRDSVPIISGLLQLRYVENTGAAFGILRDSTTFLVIVSFGVIGLLAVIFWSMIGRSPVLGMAFGLQLGGAIGNLVDRIRLGYVVDFIDVVRFPTFNVADSGITVGVVILSFVLLFRPDIGEMGERSSDLSPDELSTQSADGEWHEPRNEGPISRDSEL